MRSKIACISFCFLAVAPVFAGQLWRASGTRSNAEQQAREATDAGVLEQADAEVEALRNRIVNGQLTHRHPTTGALLLGLKGVEPGSWCTGTLVGCSTFLTAAHCFDDDPAKEHYRVFFQHAGFFAVDGYEIHKDYAFPDDDIAVVRLTDPAAGIPPSRLNSIQRVAAGAPGTSVGFGRSGGSPSSNRDYGVKRSGTVDVSTCGGSLSDTLSICWEFKGVGSNTCNGDSGGPLFVEVGGATVVAGVTSGGVKRTCQSTDYSHDTRVFTYASWIEKEAQGDLGGERCGDLSQFGSDDVVLDYAFGTLNDSTPEEAHELDLRAGVSLLRVAINGLDNDQNDFDLFVRRGAAASETEFDCRDARSSQYGFCEIEDPPAGPWHFLVKRKKGSGVYQLTITSFN